MIETSPGVRAKVHHAALLPPTFAGVPVSFVMGWAITLLLGGLVIMTLSRPPSWRTAIYGGLLLTGMALLWIAAKVATRIHPQAVEMAVRWVLLPTHLGNR